MIVLGHDFESPGLSLVTSKRKQLRPWQYFNLPTVMVTDPDTTHAWGDHAVSGNHHAVYAVKGNNDCHRLKALFAFISG
jgi:hypothetical protein